MSDDKNKKTAPQQTYYEKQAEALYNLIVNTDHKWRKEWATEEFKQQNGKKTAYQNINQLSLFNRAVDEGFKDPRWFTFNQIKENGWQLEKGSKASRIAFATRSQMMLVKDDNGKPILNEKNQKQYKKEILDKPFFVQYNVFNGSNIKGIEPFKIEPLTEENQLKLKQKNYQDAENMVNAFCEKYNVQKKEIASERAFFSQDISNDKNHVVLMPLKEQFKDIESYYATLFHEVGHSTKTIDGLRINKETDTPHGNQFGSKNYAKEELTAELTSLFLCREFNIDSSKSKTEEQSLSYIKSWLQNGQLDKKDLEVSLKEANRATKVIFSEHIALQKKLEQNKIEGVKEVKEVKEVKAKSSLTKKLKSTQQKSKTKKSISLH